MKQAGCWSLSFLSATAKEPLEKVGFFFHRALGIGGRSDGGRGGGGHTLAGGHIRGRRDDEVQKRIRGILTTGFDTDGVPVRLGATNETEGVDFVAGTPATRSARRGGFHLLSVANMSPIWRGWRSLFAPRNPFTERQGDQDAVGRRPRASISAISASE
jgi:hypothetical protein